MPAPETFTPPSQNPWRALLTVQDPAIAAATAEAVAAHARARAASPPVTLSAGVMARPGAPEPLMYGNLSVPLQNPNAAARALAKTGPEVIRNPTPNSRAMICASVVLPSPGGPWNSV